MIPAEACMTNRTTQAGLVASNILSGRTPPRSSGSTPNIRRILGTNATPRTGYGSVVSTALGAWPSRHRLPRRRPTRRARPRRGPRRRADRSPGRAADECENSPSRGCAGQGRDGAEPAGGMMSSMMGQFGQVGGHLFGQPGRAVAADAGQAPQMLSGMLGPLSSMQGMNGAASAAAIAPGAAGGSRRSADSAG